MIPDNLGVDRPAARRRELAELDREFRSFGYLSPRPNLREQFRQGRNDAAIGAGLALVVCAILVIGEHWDAIRSWFGL